MNDPATRSAGGPAVADRAAPLGARRLLRRALGPLAAYHVMILVGAALIVEGRLHGSPTWFDLGVALAVAGIVLELLILGWTYRLAASAAARSMPRVDAAPREPSVPTRLCVSCAWHGRWAGACCPRCGKIGLVRTYGERPETAGDP
jgi:hypothetical protein